jgi:uncharacterized protein YggE
MSADLDELERIVQRMRKLGVTRWNGIELGPEPVSAAQAPSPDEAAKRARDRQAKRRDILFAASSIKPKLPTIPSFATDKDKT